MSKNDQFDGFYQVWIKLGRELVDMFPDEVEDYPQELPSFDELIMRLSNVRAKKDYFYEFGIILPTIIADTEERAREQAKMFLKNSGYTMDLVEVK